ncbi:hypothetical protein [Streptomyces chrestomyceticus]|uniref:hypothetical protein n=1 Tax=Streptomyces chrestomyceticus TaxID=68185 RepID=UPI0039DFCCCC
MQVEAVARMLGRDHRAQPAQVGGGQLVPGVVVDVEHPGGGAGEGPPATGQCGELGAYARELGVDVRLGQGRTGAGGGVELVVEADVRAAVQSAPALVERLDQAGAQHMTEVLRHGLDDRLEVEVQPVEEVGAGDSGDAPDLVRRLAVVAEADAVVVPASLGGPGGHSLPVSGHRPRSIGTGRG